MLQQVPLKRIGHGGEVAEVVRFLAGDGAELHHRPGHPRQRRTVHVSQVRSQRRWRDGHGRSRSRSGSRRSSSSSSGSKRTRCCRRRSSSRTSGADSLDTVELVMAFEEEFDLEIPDEDAEKIATVGDAIQLHQGELVGAGARRSAWTRGESSSPGLGAVTPMGNTAEEFWAALTRASRGSGPSPGSTPPLLPTRIAGEVKGFDSLKLHRQEGRPQARPVPQVRGRLRGRWRWRTRASNLERGGRDPVRRPGGLGHRRHQHAAGEPQGAAREGTAIGYRPSSSRC